MFWQNTDVDVKKHKQPFRARSKNSLFTDLLKHLNSLEQINYLDVDARATFYVLRGVSYSQVNRSVEAIADFTQAITLQPDEHVNYHERGLSYYEQKDYASAIADFTMTIKYDNNATESSSMAFGNRGIAKLSLQQDGCPDIKKAIDLGNKNMSKFYIEYCD